MTGWKKKRNGTAYKRRQKPASLTSTRKTPQAPEINLLSLERQNKTLLRKEGTRNFYCLREEGVPNFLSDRQTKTFFVVVKLWVYRKNYETMQNYKEVVKQ